MMASTLSSMHLQAHLQMAHLPQLWLQQQTGCMPG